MIATHHLVVGVVLALALSSCRSGDGEDAILLPHPNDGFDYQLGGSYDPTPDQRRRPRSLTWAFSPQLVAGAGFEPATFGL